MYSCQRTTAEMRKRNFATFTGQDLYNFKKPQNFDLRTSLELFWLLEYSIAILKHVMTVLFYISGIVLLRMSV